MPSLQVSTVLAALALVGSMLSGCSEPKPRTGVLVTGQLLDAESGAPVSRENIYVHAFNDATKTQVSVEPGGDAEFELEIPAPEIRLRVADTTNVYELFEQDYVAKGGRLDVEVRLQPTHWVRLHGTILWRDGQGRLRPLSEGDGQVRDARLSAGREVQFDPDGDGEYSVMAPREALEISTINTSYVSNPASVDLSGVTGEEHKLDLVLTAKP